MIDQYYQLLYLMIVTIATIPYYNKYSSSSNTTLVRDNSHPVWCLVVFLIFFIGLRPTTSNYFGDTVGYAGYYSVLSTESFSFDSEKVNLIFDNLMPFMASNGLSYTKFLIVCSTVYFVARYASVKKMFPQNVGIAYVMFLASFVTYSSAINGYKAGAAASLFCCAIAFYKDFPKKWWRPSLFLVLSMGFHHSMHVCIAAYMVCVLYKKSKVYYAFWLFCFACAALHIMSFQELFAQYTDESGASYLLSDQDEGWHTGMRYDFVLYSAMPVLLSWYVKYKMKLIIEGYDFIVNLYLLLNGIWMLCMYASFTNRIAALSWFMYSIVLCYPFLKGEQIFRFNKNKTIASVMLLQLSFTLFMYFVYYA